MLDGGDEAEIEEDGLDGSESGGRVCFGELPHVK